jgi:hypothetical protein
MSNSSWYIYTIFFICSSMLGISDDSSLALVNRAAVNMGVEALLLHIDSLLQIYAQEWCGGTIFSF